MRKHNSVSPFENALKQGLLDYICDTYPAVEIVENLSVENFDKIYRGKRPIIIRGATSRWSAMGKWSFDYFKKSYGKIEITANGYYQKPQRMSIGQLVDQIKEFDSGRSSSEPPTLQEWMFYGASPRLLEDIECPVYIKADPLLQKIARTSLSAMPTIWMGAKGAITFLHHDAYAASVINCQVIGKKKWLFFPPTAKNVSNDLVQLRVDPKKYFEDPDNTPLHCEAQRGDFVYMPPRWWHRVYALEASINLSSNYMTVEDLPSLYHETVVFGLMGWLSQEKLRETDPGRYATLMDRARSRASFYGLNPDDILGLETDSPAFSFSEVLQRGKKAA